MKTLTGKVVSLKNTKTALVEVENHFQHPLYKKFLTRTKRYAVAIEEKDKLELGQAVNIESCKPISKTKKFKLSKPKGKV